MSEMSISVDGWLTVAKKVVSPNYAERPDKQAIELIIVHGISLPPNEFGGPYIEQLFTNQLDPKEHEYFATIAKLKVSAHCLIKRDGKIIQFVSFLDSAWHAGRSQWKNRENCNDFSIGIELEGADHIRYTDVQYEQLNFLVDTLKTQYHKIKGESLVGHCDVAPGRKTDPGEAFEWHRLKTV